MRTLLLMRGIPASGKSSWIQSHNLQHYSISPDDLRLMAQSPLLKPNGEYAISQENDSKVWKILFELLEMRMQKGDFTIIDATHINKNAIARYDALCKKYRYRITIVDFSSVSLEVAKERNKNRGLKAVPEEVLEKMHTNLLESLKNPLPSRYKVIQPDEFKNLKFAPLNLSSYEKIHHIGDVHGCFSALIEYLRFQSAEYCGEKKANIESALDFIMQNSDNGANAKVLQECQESYATLATLLNPKEYYIFVGDYLDRGIENGKVMRFLLSVMELPNVCLLEGNHERWLRKWGEGEEVSKEFSVHTLADLQRHGIEQKDARNLYRKLRQCSVYAYGQKVMIATHGGLSNLPYTSESRAFGGKLDSIESIHLLLLSSKQIIYGTGGYEDLQESAKSFTQNTPKHFYQVFGHRNREKIPMCVYERNFALEGGVEFGGDLRVLIASSDSHLSLESKLIESNPASSIQVEHFGDGLCGVSVKNEIYRTNYKQEMLLFNTIESMRKSSSIKEKTFENGRISSFNYAKEVFYKKKWTNLNCKARGFFVDNAKMSIIARSYDKFFNLNEREETSLEYLAKTLSYPLEAFIKENGFLGILGVFDEKLFFTSKSDPTSSYARIFENIFKASMGEKTQEKLLERLKKQNLSLVFEVIEPVLDPHIIAYDEPKIILLDAIYNTIEFAKLPFCELQEFAKEFGFMCKRHVREAFKEGFAICSNKELKEFIESVSGAEFSLNGERIEGFVLEDSKGFQFKLKLEYYMRWKLVRGFVEQCVKLGKVIKPKYKREESEEFFESFYLWFAKEAEQKGIESFREASLIALREGFLRERKE